MHLTLNQAAKSVGKSTSTISRYIKDGKLSVAEKSDDGSFKIDPSELYRVFPERHKTSQKEQSATQSQTPSNTREIELLEKINTQQSEIIRVLQKQLDEEREERQKITMMLLEHQTQAGVHHKISPSLESEQKLVKKRWWQRRKTVES